MKIINITKNGRDLGTFSYNENSNESLKRFCIRVSKTNVNTTFELKINGDFTRTYKN